jgi:hypothetical protein
LKIVIEYSSNQSAAPEIKQQEKRLNEEQEQMIEKKADGANEDCPCCTKEEKCWWHMPKSSGLTNRGTFRHGQR